jgi:hypothetical protein
MRQRIKCIEFLMDENVRNLKRSDREIRTLTPKVSGNGEQMSG